MSTRHGNLQKYQNTNPVQRALIDRFLRQVYVLVEDLRCSALLDAGCAEGFVSAYLTTKLGHSISVTGVDLDVEALRRSREDFTIMQPSVSNVMALPFPSKQFDLVLCTEVLEHLPDPRSALQELLRVTGTYCLLSVPHEPWFRTMNFVRGRHVKRFGNDPEHLQNWGSRQFVGLVSEYFEVLKVRSVLPWLVVLGARR